MVYTIKGPALVYFGVSKQFFNQAKILEEYVEILVLLAERLLKTANSIN